MESTWSRDDHNKLAKVWALVAFGVGIAIAVRCTMSLSNIEIFSGIAEGTITGGTNSMDLHGEPGNYRPGARSSDIRYSYTVQGEQFSGHERLPVNSSIDERINVRYDPSRPHISYIARMERQQILWRGISLTLFALAISAVAAAIAKILYWNRALAMLVGFSLVLASIALAFKSVNYFTWAY